jgi:hypothetical protein
VFRKLANERALTPPFIMPPEARQPFYDWYAAGYIQITRP